MNKIQWNLYRNSNIFIQKNAFQCSVCEMAAILYRPQCGYKTESVNINRNNAIDILPASFAAHSTRDNWTYWLYAFVWTRPLWRFWYQIKHLYQMSDYITLSYTWHPYIYYKGWFTGSFLTGFRYGLIIIIIDSIIGPSPYNCVFLHVCDFGKLRFNPLILRSIPPDRFYKNSNWVDNIAWYHHRVRHYPNIITN